MNSLKPLRDYLKDAGDCELREIKFSVEDVTLVIHDPYFATTFTISINNVTIFVFLSNHMQNVISSIIYGKDLADIDVNKQGIEEMIFRTIPTISHFPLKKDKPYLYIEPISGPSLFAQFERLQMAYVTPVG